jgi:hypothetical protein
MIIFLIFILKNIYINDIIHIRRPKMKKNLYLLGLISVILIIVTTLLSCGTAKSPSSVVRQFYKAMEKDDRNALNDVLTPETLQILSAMYEKIKENLFENGKIAKTEETIDGDTAAVIVTYENGETASYDLIKQDGKWKIHLSK